MKHEYFAWFEPHLNDRFVGLEVALRIRYVLYIPKSQWLLRHRVCEILVIDTSDWAKCVYFMHEWTVQNLLMADEMKRISTR